jgi:hypothetical protein
MKRVCRSIDNLAIPYQLHMPAVKHDGVLDWFWLTNMMYYLPLAHATPMVTFDTGILN